jgi:hypothetical protein
MSQEVHPPEQGIVAQAHAIDLGVRLALGGYAIMGAIGSIVAQFYGHLGLGLTLILAALFTLAITQIPLIIPWSRKYFVMWRSRYPWLAILFASILVLIAGVPEYLPRLTGRPAMPVPLNFFAPLTGSEFVKDQNVVQRTLIAEVRDYVKNQDLSVPIISRNIGGNGEYVFWFGDIGDSDRGRSVLFFGNQDAGLRVIDDNQNEQHFYFLLTGGSTPSVSGPKPYPGIVPADYLNFPEKWEAADTK